jgi:hypothetical protein
MFASKHKHTRTLLKNFHSQTTSELLYSTHAQTFWSGSSAFVNRAVVVGVVQVCIAHELL